MKKFVDLKSKILYLRGGEYLIVFDSENRLFYFDDSFRLIKLFKLNIKRGRLYDNNIKISNNSKYLLIALNNVLTLWDLEERKNLATFFHKKDITSTAFSKDDKYFSAGDINGEIYVYNTALKKKVYELKKHKDFITDLSFYEDRSYIVAGGYDKCVIFHNLITLQKNEKYYHTGAVKKIKKQHYLISADEMSTVVNWDALKKEFKDITQFYKTFRDFRIFKNYLIIAADKNVIIYNLDDYAIENENFLEFPELEKIEIFKNYLILSNTSGEIYYRNLFQEEKIFLDLILKEEYKKAFELIDKNPFLKFSKGFEKLNKIIELEIKRAKELFLVNEADAIKILDKFLIIPQLGERIEKTIKEFRNYKKFVFAIKQQNYTLSYLLASQYPMLKETKYYKLLENKWHIAFEKAKEYALKGEIEKAKEILFPFMSVNEKLPLIELLLKQSSVFNLLKEKLAKRDFKGFFALVKTHPELKNTPEYLKVMNYANTLYSLCDGFIQNEDFEKAKKAALILEDIEGFEDKAKKILEKVNAALKFLHFISNKEYKKAIELADIYSFLKELQSYKELIQKHNNIYEKVEELMAKGNKEKALQIMQKEGIISRNIDLSSINKG